MIFPPYYARGEIVHRDFQISFFKIFKCSFEVRDNINTDFLKENYLFSCHLYDENLLTELYIILVYEKFCFLFI